MSKRVMSLKKPAKTHSEFFYKPSQDFPLPATQNSSLCFEANSGIKKFEDLTAWQKSRELAHRVYEETRKESFARDYGLRGQIQRAAVSIVSNIAEGFERGGLGEFHQFLSIAKASCAELRSQLYIASDIGYLTREEFKDLLSAAEEVARIIGGLRSSLAKKKAMRKQTVPSDEG